METIDDKNTMKREFNVDVSMATKAKMSKETADKTFLMLFASNNSFFGLNNYEYLCKEAVEK